MADSEYRTALWDTRNIGYDDFEDEIDFELSDGECLDALRGAEAAQERFPERSSQLVEHVVDEEALKTWVRPPRDRTRTYQDSLAEASFFKNSLIVLPTGLGKTMIAIVVMYNYMRWFPESKIIFTTPTKSLVDQQMKAYIYATKSSGEGIISITGLIPPSARARLWGQNRIFFLTPQILCNDVNSGICDARKISLMVFDEAHHATKDYYYCKAVRKMVEMGCSFRIMGLTATPGSNIDSVQDVVLNLLIESVSFRTENCSDVAPYLYKKNIIKYRCDMSERMEFYSKKLDDIMESYLEKLRCFPFFKKKKLSSINRFLLIKMMFNKSPKSGKSGVPYRSSSGDVKDSDLNFLSKFPSAHQIIYSLSTLLNAKHLLETYGIAQCLNLLGKFKQPRYKTNSPNQDDIKSISCDYRVSELAELMEKDMQNPSLARHPKINVLCSILTRFFENSNDDETDEKRALVFSQYRTSVEEINEALTECLPRIKSSAFMGKVGKYTQKSQLKTLQDFKDGIYNVLVCTSVAEEGLDIGQVDMVVSYDLQKSAIRLVQRMGRTSRRRDGTIVFLLTGEKSIFAYRTAMLEYEKIKSHIKEEQGKKLIMPTHESCLRLPQKYGPPKCDNAPDSNSDSDSDQMSSNSTHSNGTIYNDATKVYSEPLSASNTPIGTQYPSCVRQNDLSSITIHPKLASFLYSHKKSLSSYKDTNKYHPDSKYFPIDHWLRPLVSSVPLIIANVGLSARKFALPSPILRDPIRHLSCKCAPISTVIFTRNLHLKYSFLLR